MVDLKNGDTPVDAKEEVDPKAWNIKSYRTMERVGKNKQFDMYSLEHKDNPKIKTQVITVDGD